MVDSRKVVSRETIDRRSRATSQGLHFLSGEKVNLQHRKLRAILFHTCISTVVDAITGPVKSMRFGGPFSYAKAAVSPQWSMPGK